MGHSLCTPCRSQLPQLMPGTRISGESGPAEKELNRPSYAMDLASWLSRPMADGESIQLRVHP